MSQPIVIDSDPGIDDALAIAFTFSAGLSIKFITTVYGNSDIQNVTRNAGYVVRSLGAELPIFQGSVKPLTGKSYRAESHGVSGLGNLTPEQNEIAKPADSSAMEALIGLLESGVRPTIFCLGPLTNIANLFQDRIDLAQKIDKLVIMGGAFLHLFP